MKKGKGRDESAQMKTEGFVQRSEVCDASSEEQCVPCLFPTSPPRWPPPPSSPHTLVRSLTRSPVRFRTEVTPRSLCFLRYHFPLNNLNLHHDPDLSPSQGPAEAHYYLPVADHDSSAPPLELRPHAVTLQYSLHWRQKKPASIVLASPQTSAGHWAHPFPSRVSLLSLSSLRKSRPAVSSSRKASLTKPHSLFQALWYTMGSSSSPSHLYAFLKL